MNPTAVSLAHDLRPVILEKRARLQAAAQSVAEPYLRHLLDEVDSALRRIDDGTFGFCENCHDPIEPERLAADPFCRFCLDHLTQAERRAHEQDLELATQIQSKLLPARDVAAGGWRTHYRYQPAGIVGGDYCEVLPCSGGHSVFFALGDVTGKGVAASLLMTHLNAIFRSLLTLDLSLCDLLRRANRLFCESTPATHFATLVAGRAADGELHLCNAGHCRPLVLRRRGIEWVDSTALPIGLFCDGKYETARIALEPGETVVLYSDGVTEAQDPAGNSYDECRLVECLRRLTGLDAPAMADAVLREVDQFRAAGPQQDDITLLIVQRTAP